MNTSSLESRTILCPKKFKFRFCLLMPYHRSIYLAQKYSTSQPPVDFRTMHARTSRCLQGQVLLQCRTILLNKLCASFLFRIVTSKFKIDYSIVDSKREVTCRFHLKILLIGIDNNKKCLSFNICFHQFLINQYGLFHKE